jgi:hypothetical protein
MNIIAKPINQEVVDNGYYELFTTEILKDIDGNEVEIPRSIGQYSLAQLEQEKSNAITNHETYIESLNEKITAINNLK